MRSTARRFVGVLVLAALTALACTAVPAESPQPDDQPPSSQRCASQAATDIAYASVPGVDPNLLSLDVYPPPDACTGNAAPVVVWVHGGGWSTGDKDNLANKRQWAATHGWVFVSINYRLSPSAFSEDPHRVVHPTHAHDVADAVAWVAAHIADHGGDGNRLALIGHSAGGHLVSLVSADERYLAEASAPTGVIDCTVALDTEGYDLTAKLTGADRSTAMVHNAFGDDPAVIRDASPLFHVESGARFPAFLIVTRGADARQEVARQFASTITAAGGSAQVLAAPGYSHSDVNRRLGEPGETVVTPTADQFLASCFAMS